MISLMKFLGGDKMGPVCSLSIRKRNILLNIPIISLVTSNKDIIGQVRKPS